MKLLDLNDPCWENFDSGYSEYDPRVTEWIKTLLSGNFAESHWNFLWDELHHQNDVWETSYAVIPYLVEYAKKHENYDWQIFGFPVVVELAKLDIENPAIPEVIEASYFWSFKELAKIALAFDSWTEEQTPVIAACIALAKGQRIFARAYLEMSSVDTAKNFLLDEIGWEPRESDL